MKRVISAVICIGLFPSLFGCIGPYVRSPRSDVPFDYQIKWIMAGAKTLITALDVEVIDSRLNLFNSKSLVSVRIKGTMSYQKGWKPYVKYIHIAELLGNGQNDTGHSADVILTPFVSCEEDEKYRGEAVDFSLSQEILLYSMNWGKNLYTVRCGEITKSVELHQQK